MLNDLLSELAGLKDQKRTPLLQRYFKTGKGEYAAGDIFYGLSVPQARTLASKYSDLPIKDVFMLLKSKIHEARLIALFILVHQFKKGDEKLRKEIFESYLSNTKYINNWDLVDLSAPKIVGEYLMDKPRDILEKLAKSEVLWERRIAVLSTFQFINEGESKDAFKIAKILISDQHDLIHKAVGWMLREVGKRVGTEAEKEFLKPIYKIMPRTALRYAIEHFPQEERLKYLKGEI